MFKELFTEASNNWEIKDITPKGKNKGIPVLVWEDGSDSVSIGRAKEDGFYHISEYMNNGEQYGWMLNQDFDGVISYIKTMRGFYKVNIPVNVPKKSLEKLKPLKDFEAGWGYNV